MALHPAILRRSVAARSYAPSTRTKVQRLGHYSEDSDLRRQVRDLERRAAEASESQGAKTDEQLSELEGRLRRLEDA